MEAPNTHSYNWGGPIAIAESQTQFYPGVVVVQDPHATRQHYLSSCRSLRDSRPAVNSMEQVLIEIVPGSGILTRHKI